MMTGRTRAPPEKVEEDPEAEYKSAWKQFDSSMHGSITASQFRQMLAGMGEKVTDVEVDEIINSVDGEDKITCEYVEIWETRC
jgi:Ca2+-binding EF-hand superfamily protein